MRSQTATSTPSGDPWRSSSGSARARRRPSSPDDSASAACGGSRPASRHGAEPGQPDDAELEVVGLGAYGLTNAEIAERLFLSEKTVNHHVSAILQKLCATPGEASGEAVRLGIAGQNR